MTSPPRPMVASALGSQHALAATHSRACFRYSAGVPMVYPLDQERCVWTEVFSQSKPGVNRVPDMSCGNVRDMSLSAPAATQSFNLGSTVGLRVLCLSRAPARSLHSYLRTTSADRARRPARPG